MPTTLVIICCCIGASLGILGALSFIITYSILQEIRTRFRFFILSLSTYNLLVGISVLLPGFKQKTLCSIQVFLTNYSFGAAYFWVFEIALIYYLQIRKGYDFENSKKFYWISIIIIQIVCLVFGILTVALGNPTKETSYWCTISKRWLMEIEYSLVTIFLIGSLFIYFLIIHKIRKYKDGNYPKTFQTKMLALAIVYLLTELWNIIKRVWQIFQNTKNSNDFFDATQAFFTPLIGFWDFVFFVWGDKFVWALLLRKWKKQNYDELN
ncbi:g protein-coupled receptor [Anaeramoeba ignava]|uniref:G protein-coupled receptor n=1 Tax=Anaeramoeba ignava TaxID=1746090 RepID=A0A9Q0LD22_ANAIG|nr:g protein-coupled receptor [Anaeramoeba ignava]